MPLLHLVILALIQGITEFLPISSSGHLALYPLLSGAPDQGLALDVAVHVGTLAAVMLYFRGDVAAAVRGGLGLLRGNVNSQEARLALHLVIATIPAVVAGGALSLFDLTGALRSLQVIAWATILGGVLLWLGDRFGREKKQAGEWRLSDALAMGVAQTFALIPGMSRSGVTITAARALGYIRVDAARLSMLMSIPVIVAAGMLIGIEIAEAGDSALTGDSLIAMLLSFFAALAAIAVFMRMLERWSMTVFVVYRILLGVALLLIANW
ncbi:undecaprenyl-diphosphate phosphatase [Pikeienuella piscinae]|uniref:Undecaprenyl-diphosphatase n=1 Tax=Pikeienuella piscinae TaxID=2748098 RepID=A0A7L5BYE1_9RHOB|nr:undecaprenyl-diphosphate phosphatase [Pikeienuella piscinae]QIE55537.1 undecaprenyl-diphosphate phosphatase [Pikeienuella piscinae]